MRSRRSNSRRDPGAPYSVNVWGIGVGPHFYVAAADRENRWARNVLEDPRVRLRVGESIYELRAVPTNDAVEVQAFRDGLKRKYNREPDPAHEAKAQLFRLVPRSR